MKQTLWEATDTFSLPLEANPTSIKTKANKHVAPLVLISTVDGGE
jgi:hypothetical protein